MGLLVYAVCRTGSLDPSLLPSGCGGASVHSICTERVSALFSEIDGVPAQASDAEFDAFDRVIEGAHRQGPTLPVRYGTTYSDDALLSRAIRHSAVPLCEDLKRVDGRAEISVTLTGAMARQQRVVTRKARVASPVVVHATAGSSALKTRSIAAEGGGPGANDKNDEQTLDLTDLAVFCRTELADLTTLASEVLIEDATALSPAGVMRCLVARPDVPLFESTFEELRGRLGFEGRISDPGPCYSFATQTIT